MTEDNIRNSDGGSRLTAGELSQFTGSEHWYRHGLIRNVAFTDGAKYLADRAGCYWLLDIIAIAQRYSEPVEAQWYQIWQLTVSADRKAAVICEDGNGKELYHQSISWTDFPLDSQQLLCCRDGVIGQGIDWVILLPSEY